MAKSVKPKTFRERLDQLQEIVERLESGELPLEEAIDRFEEGRKLHLSLQDELLGYERRLEKTLAPGGGNAEPAAGGADQEGQDADDRAS